MFDKIFCKNQLLMLLLKKVYSFIRLFLFGPRVDRIAYINALRTIKIVKCNRKPGLFIDCGANMGQAFNFFSRYYPIRYFDYELFEPNPYCFEVLNETLISAKHNVVLHKKAVSVENGAVKFYGISENEGGIYAQGGSIIKDHNSLFYNSNETQCILVETIAFSKYLIQKLNEYENIVIKMDIEGSEYAVIEDLLNQDIFSYIDTFYIEFHSQYMNKHKRNEYLKKELQLIECIKKTNCVFIKWH